MRTATPTVRVVAIGLLSLLFVVPLLLIGNVVGDRRGREREARAEIQRSWAGPQLVAGPALAVELDCTDDADDGRIPRRRLTTLALLPAALELEGSMKSERRSRGIYEALLYRSKLALRGRFELAADDLVPPDCLEPRFAAAHLVLGIADPRGIDELADGEIAGTALEWRPGSPLGGAWQRGPQARLPLDLLPTGPRTTLPFSMRLELRGSESLQLVPVGLDTRVRLSGDWGEPSFRGAFLPADRRVDEAGFEAGWRISPLARSLPTSWAGGDPPDEVHCSAFGLSLLVPVDGYQRVERALKYGLLIVVLTLVAVFLFELGSELRLHLVQYGLVGAALCVFYLLLLSLSEHVGFGAAYALAASAVAALVASYARAVLRDARDAAKLAGVLTALYTGLFALLTAEDYALLVGSIALFLILAFLMWRTRLLDWSRPLAAGEETAP